MRKKILFFVTALITAVIFLFNGCKKDHSIIQPISPPPPPVIAQSFSQEFDSFYLLKNRGWAFINNSAPNAGNWMVSYGRVDSKSGVVNGPLIKEYSKTFAYAGYWSTSTPATINSWMLTPPVEMKNGDKISFYTCSDSIAGSINRLQVRLNPTDTTSNVGTSLDAIGNFTTLLTDINPGLTANDYPRVWTKFEVTLSGLPGNIISRIGFRYYNSIAAKQNAIGIDALQFQKL